MLRGPLSSKAPSAERPCLASITSLKQSWPRAPGLGIRDLSACRAAKRSLNVLFVHAVCTRLNEQVNGKLMPIFRHVLVSRCFKRINLEKTDSMGNSKMWYTLILGVLQSPPKIPAPLKWRVAFGP